jgi:hypothetical protein
MLRFTIRDVLWLMAVVGIGVGWWVDHRKLAAVNEKYRVDIGELGLRLIPLQTLLQGDRRIRAIHEQAKMTPPPAEAAAEIIYHVRYDKDYRIRLRAMAVMPYLSERTESINVLLDALRERDVDKIAEGLVPQYAAVYLAEMNATEAIRPMEDWLAFLENEVPFDPEMRAILIKSAKRNLAKLKAVETAAAP